MNAPVPAVHSGTKTVRLELSGVADDLIAPPAAIYTRLPGARDDVFA